MQPLLIASGHTLLCRLWHKSESQPHKGGHPGKEWPRRLPSDLALAVRRGGQDH